MAQYHDSEDDEYFHYETDSAIQRTPDGRIGHISSFLFLSEEGIVLQFETFYMYAAAFLAMEHFNSRNGVVIPELPDILNDCDFHLTMDLQDTRHNQRVATELVMDTIFGDRDNNNNNSSSNNKTIQKQQPFAILGPVFSGISHPMSILADAFQIVQMSGTATSPMLEKSQHFTRTVPSNEGESAAVMTYLSSMGISRVGILYGKGPYGEGFQQALMENAQKNNITVAISMPCISDNDQSINSSMKLLKESDVRYIVAAINEGDKVYQSARIHGIMGAETGRQWLLPEYKGYVDSNHEIDTTKQPDLADALDGVAIIHLHNEKNDGFERETQNLLFTGQLEKEAAAMTITAADGLIFTNNSTSSSNMQQRLIASLQQPNLVQGVTFPPMNTSIFSYLMYDAVMALGIAACRTPGLFTTDEFLMELLQSEFPGASGWVALDKTTGSRLAKDLPFKIDNLRISQERSTNSITRLDVITTGYIQGPNVTNLPSVPFVYSGNTTIAPPEIPDVDSYEYNLIPMWLLAIGWVLGGLALLTSVGFAAWTIVNRQHHIVRISQPVFLCQLCLGTFIMATAIIPLSMQEQEDGNNNLSSKWNLDAACMAVPWLRWIGFVTAFSAILAKTLRLNKLMKKSRGMKRVSVHPTDVLQPLMFLMTCNIVLLLSCTLVAPYTWHRIPVENNVDRYGRSVESFGTCQHYTSPAPDTDPRTYYFMIPLRIVNFVGLGVAAWHCYKARDLPTEMSESRYLFVATISLLEVHLIGGPILFLPTLSPTAYYLVASSMISLSCFSILLPIFVPKYQQHKAHAGQGGGGRNNLVDIRAMKGGRARNTTYVQSATESGVHQDEATMMNNPPKRPVWGKMSVERRSAT